MENYLKSQVSNVQSQIGRFCFWIMVFLQRQDRLNLKLKTLIYNNDGDTVLVLIIKLVLFLAYQ